MTNVNLVVMSYGNPSLELRSSLPLRLFISVVGGLLVALANSAAVTGSIMFRSKVMWASSILYIFLIFLSFEGFSRFLDKSRRVGIEEEIKWHKFHVMLSSLFSNKNRVRNISIISIIILVSWTPWIIWLAPGTLQGDVDNQIGAYYGIPSWGARPGEISDHHPFLTTYVFGLFSDLGIALFGTYAWGLFILVIIQCITVAVTYSFTLIYMRNRFNVGFPILVSFLAFICIFPLVPDYMMNISKDTLHIVFLLLWTILFIMLTESKLLILNKLPFSIPFFFVSLLVALTKKTGLWVVVISLAVIFFIKATRKLKMVLGSFVILIPLIVSVLIPKFLYPVLNVIPTDNQQFFVVPLQLTARYSHDHPDSITEEEEYVINNFNIHTFKEMGGNYDYFLVDPVAMGSLNDSNFTGSYLKVWLKQGFRHPKSYVNGLAALESGWFAFSRSYSEQPSNPAVLKDSRMWGYFDHHTGRKEYPDILDEDSPEGNHTAQTVYNAFRSIPFIGSLTFTAVWTWILPLFVLYYLIYTRELKSKIFLFLPYYLSMFSLYVGSTSYITRYMMPLLFLAPIMFTLLCTRRKEGTAN